MVFSTYDKSKFNMKLELTECQLFIDQIQYNCVFGKARTVSSGKSDPSDSLIIVAFLEDDLLGEIHTTLKIFLNSNTTISEVVKSPVSIIGPQSKISHMWSLNGTAILTKISTSSNNILDETISSNLISNKTTLDD
jgi:hypothetical protein